MYGVLVIDLKMKNDKLLSSERFRDLLGFSFILFKTNVHQVNGSNQFKEIFYSIMNYIQFFTHFF